MVLAIDSWLALLANLVQQACPLDHVLFLFSHLLKQRVIDSVSKHKDCVHDKFTLILRFNVYPVFAKHSLDFLVH